MLPTHVLNGIVQFSSERSAVKLIRGSNILRKENQKNLLKVVESVVLTRFRSRDVPQYRFEMTIKNNVSNFYQLTNFVDCVEKLRTLAPKQFELTGNKIDCIEIIEALGIHWFKNITEINVSCKKSKNVNNLPLLENLFNMASAQNPVKQISFKSGAGKHSIIFHKMEERKLKLITEVPIALTRENFTQLLEKLQFTKYPSITLSGDPTAEMNLLVRQLFEIRQPRTLLDGLDSFYITNRERKIKIAEIMVC